MVVVTVVDVAVVTVVVEAVVVVVPVTVVLVAVVVGHVPHMALQVSRMCFPRTVSGLQALAP